LNFRRVILDFDYMAKILIVGHCKLNVNDFTGLLRVRM